MGLLVPLLVVFGALMAVPLVAHREPARRALALRRAALGWTVVFAVVAGMFIVGETFTDPGGAEAVWLIASWLVPMVGLSLLAWFRPRAAFPVLSVLLVVGLVVSAWTEIGLEDFREDQGPLDAISLFAVSIVPLGVLGWHRPSISGVLLLVAAVLPTVFLQIGSTVPLGASLGGSTAAATVPGCVAGLLYLLAAWFERRAAPPAAAPPGQPDAGLVAT